MIRWLVINDPAKVHRIAGMTIDWMKAVKEKNTALYQEAKLELFVEPWEAGKIVFPGGLRASSWPMQRKMSGRRLRLP